MKKLHILSHYLPRVLAVLIMLTAVSSVMVSGRFARYTSTASGSDTARVAVFAVDAGREGSGNLALDCTANDKTAKYQFYVTNNENSKTAEVAVDYTVTVTLDQALPTGITLSATRKIGSGTVVNVPVSASSDRKVFTITGAQLPAGTAQQHNYTLVFTGVPTVTFHGTVQIASIQIATAQVD